MNLFWGVRPVRRSQSRTAEEMLQAAVSELKRQAVVKPGDVLGVVAGTQMASGSTNFMRLHMVAADNMHAAGRRKLPRPNRA